MRIVKSNRQHIYGLTSEQRDKIKEALTFNNPAYANAKRYAKRGYISIPPYLTYYSEFSVSENGERKKVLSVPLGVNVEKILETPIPFRDFSNKRCKVPVDYPKFLLELRKDQEKAESHYIWSVKKETYPKNIIQLPTGKGKSILALHIACTLKQKTLILVHKDDLVVGWTKDIKLCFGDNIDVGLIKAKKRKIGEQFTIATVQTLSRMNYEEVVIEFDVDKNFLFSVKFDYEEQKKHLLNNLTNEFGLVVQDECHHIGLNIFNIIDKFNSYYKLGLSATPTRNDGLNFVFDLFFGGICYKHIVTEDDEDICGCEVRVIDSNFKYKPFVNGNQVFNYYDFDPKDIPDDVEFVEEIEYKDRPRIPFLTIDDEAVKSSKTKIMVCKKIIEHYKQGHSVIALFTQKEHINLYYRHLCRYVPKDQIMLYYGDSKEKSEDMMKKAENKEILITLATYAKATEGTNVKSWEVEFLVSSVNNQKNVEQATGRVRRRKEGKLSPVIVYDIRYSDCYSLASHYSTRNTVYKKLKYTIIDPKEPTKKKGMFSRGYHI